MRQLLKMIAIFVTAAFAASAGRPAVVCGGVYPRLGARSASEAAALQLVTAPAAAAFGGPAANRLAFADTTDYEFPEDEEEERNVVKDAILWTAVAGVVAFFVIKVFLQGDTDVPPPPPNRKPPPPPPTFNGAAPVRLTW